MNSLIWKILGVTLLCLIFGASTLRAQGGIRESRDAAIRSELIGSWKSTLGKASLNLEFEEDGAYRIGGTAGGFAVSEAQLVLTVGEAEPVVYGVDYSAGVLTLSGGDLQQPLKFTRNLSREDTLTGILRGFWSISPVVVRDKALRILTIIGIIIAGVWMIKGLRIFSEFLIFSERGPLRFIYRSHKSRTRTVHSVALNLAKYIVIFTALGHILSELGVNYVTYLASLSVIGLAIGFGSQGLVQDLVTGFFLILDSQIAVGDMVEISGQTGTVDELGLRTTRIKNYVGQTVIIPNRNIAVVGNYSRGCLHAVIDVAVPNSTVAKRMQALLAGLSKDLAEEFEGTILNVPDAPVILHLPEAGERFVRVVFALWPAQQGLVDSQIVPRIRQQAAERELVIEYDRIAVVYRLPERVSPRRERPRRGHGRPGPGVAEQSDGEG